MDTTTLLIIVLIVLVLGGGGWYGRGRWYWECRRVAPSSLNGEAAGMTP